MKSTKIKDLMVKDHRKIVDLLSDVEKNLNSDFKIMIGVLDKFNWELEKHIFTEEKAIFTSYNPEDVIEGYKMLPELTKQHNYIINTLNNWRDDIHKKRILSDVSSIKEFIIRHKDFEEQKVYPKLDEGLKEEEKKKIVAKINEIM